MNTTDSLAHRAYARSRDDVARLLGWIEQELSQCDERARKGPEDWGHAESMQHARAKLIEVLSFISDQPGQDLEELLAEAREGEDLQDHPTE